jgi:two-component system OmpR family response regulator
MTELRHILCVDDEEDILTIIKLCLEMNGGFAVTCCRDGHEALEQAAQLRPDLILLDVMMPGLDGPATFAELRKRKNCRDIPVVFVTASVRRAETDEFLKLGASGLIRKPFDPATLCAEIEAIWRGVQEKRDRLESTP